MTQTDEPGAAGPFELGPVPDRGIRKRAVIARLHGTAFVRGLSRERDQHAKDHDRMAALCGAERRWSLRRTAVPAKRLCRRAALPLSRPRRARPGVMAPLGSRRGRA